MNRPWFGALVLLTALAGVRIAASYSQVSQTIDEAVHVAAGVEWLEKHSYRLHPENPPLARVAVALLPYWDGAESVASYDGANRTLGDGGDYPRRLHLARVGTLPAFVLLVALVYIWANSLFGARTALASVFLLTTLPAVLAHSGLATTDIAATTATLAAVLAFAHWLSKPCYSRAALLGCAVGAAALIKFTALLFLGVSAIAIVALKALVGDRSQEAGATWGRAAIQLGVAAGMGAAIVWGGYWGSAGPVDQVAHLDLDATAAASPLAHELLRVLLDARLPAPEFFFGLVQAAVHGLEGHSAYLLGEISRSGWWYFFPVAIAVKTPLPFLALALGGAVNLTRRALREREWLWLIPVIAPGAMLVSLMPSSLNIGLRHVIAVYPFLSICGGVAVVHLFGASQRPVLARGLASMLILWQFASSFAAHPDYIAYFNPIASGHPEDFLIDSDLDWGQDLGRLRDELEARGIEDASLALFTTADLRNLGLDRFHSLQPGERRKGWVAASIFSVRRQPGYGWLERYDPVALVGRSIRLYRIDPE